MKAFSRCFFLVLIAQKKNILIQAKELLCFVIEAICDEYLNEREVMRLLYLVLGGDTTALDVRPAWVIITYSRDAA